MTSAGHAPPVYAAIVFLTLFLAQHNSAAGAGLDRTGQQWAPCLEWSLNNPTCDGNPFDLVAFATFTHEETGERHRTGMFYCGEGVWRFRFTATRPGRWSLSTESEDADLDGKTGAVEIAPSPDARGFVTASGNRWCRQVGADGRLVAFVPQFVMYDNPAAYHGRPEKIDADIETFLRGHGFTGFHTCVFARWFDLGQERTSSMENDDPNPDPRTFEALELLITKVHAAGGVVHIWAWGDESRRQTPIRWGINGAADRRLQRYIAARLGPLPGWTMGYGYDLWEWVTEEDLTSWHDYVHEHFGWPHMLGARATKNTLDQISEAMDYASYEQHRPDYAKYRETIERRPGRPAFSEDRFRIRGRAKDYTMEETRRGLWHSTMAGGVANIWGNLRGGGTTAGGSKPYPRPEWIRTYADFFRRRFSLDLEPVECPDGVCLAAPDRARIIVYKEATDEVAVYLAGVPNPGRAIAVDACAPYSELELGLWPPGRRTWRAPHESDWALAIGNFPPAAAADPPVPRE